MIHRLLFFIVSVAVFSGVSVRANEATPDADVPNAAGAAYFEEHIRPLLQNRCYKCHSAQATDLHANLYIDSRPGWEKGGDSGPLLVPGSPETSLLMQVISYADDAPAQMPPEGKLPDEEIALLTKWVAMGAPDPRTEFAKHAKQRVIDLETERKHWAYQPLTVTAPPANAAIRGIDASWARTPIDRFLMAKLAEKQLSPNGPTEKYKLIRRAYLDLIGLPPTPEQVDAFVGHSSPDAFEKVIDELLASPHYGERWGRHWLDIARFAESHGFEQDYDRPNAYTYRDFVIRALNDDMPYDQFLKWQLAGDELAPTDLQAMAATGFLAAGVHATQITANQAEKERYDELDDMARTVGTTMLGLTVGCARCHDHKFDPIPNADYYGMVSTFTTTVRSDMEFRADPPGYAAALAKYEAAHKPLADKLAAYDRDELPARFDAWHKQAAAASPFPWVILDPQEVISLGAASFKKVGDGSVLFSGTNPDFDTYRFTTRTDAKNITAVRIEALADPSLPHNGPGRADNGNFDLTNLIVTARPVRSDVQPVEVKLKNPRATFEQGPHLSVAMVIDNARNSGWAVDPQFGKDHAAVFDTTDLLGFDGGTELEFTLDFSGNNRHNIGRIRLSATTVADPSTVVLNGDPAAIQSAIASLRGRPVVEAPDAQRNTILDWFKPQDEARRPLATAVEEHAKSMPQPSLIKMLISSEGVPAVRLHTQGPDFYDKTFILKRGDPNQKVTEAEQRFLTVLMNHPDGPKHWITPAPTGATTSFRRAAMANWITDTQYGAGALVARVIVNRLWQHHFGRGLVASPSDFGTQGNKPSHPELLDHLANELIVGGWKLKALHKQMLLSACFQQSSETDEKRLLADHSNTLLWRYAPRRLEAETIRDSLLAVSGKLDPTPFGSGSLDMNMPRRSIYFFMKRSQLIPMLSLFDAPDTLQDLALRSTTTVAPQALLLMNSPIIRGYAESLGSRVKQAGGNSPQSQAKALYRLCFGRDATAEEQAASAEFVEQQTAEYTAAGKQNPGELALVDWCQAVMSLNEFVFVD